VTVHIEFEQAKPIAPTPAVAVASTAIFKGDGVVFGKGPAHAKSVKISTCSVETKERDLFQ
jgi:hypothetical protein